MLLEKQQTSALRRERNVNNFYYWVCDGCDDCGPRVADHYGLAG